MSNLWINWRFGSYHLQIGPDKPWISLSQNPYHLVHKPKSFFEAY